MKQSPRLYKADAVAPVAIETKYRYVKEICIKSDKNGKRRATYFGRAAARWFPLPIAVADYLIAGEFAEQV